jgi:NAD(P)-dependent dehydrogenase (short-subunit alcohol dehydrogenase family)
MALDVTNAEQVSRVIQQAFKHFGRLDVLVNNAGTNLFAATEEASDEQSAGNIRKQFLNRLEKQTVGSPGSKHGCAVFFRADACFKLDFY